MPHPKRDYAIAIPGWVETIEDYGCLRETVLEALWSRGYALRRGALDDPDTKRIVQAADVTLAQIEDGRVRGDTACKKATAALRKYTQAWEAAKPPATKRRRR